MRRCLVSWKAEEEESTKWRTTTTRRWMGPGLRSVPGMSGVWSLGHCGIGLDSRFVYEHRRQRPQRPPQGESVVFLHFYSRVMLGMILCSKRVAEFMLRFDGCRSTWSDDALDDTFANSLFYRCHSSKRSSPTRTSRGSRSSTVVGEKERQTVSFIEFTVCILHLMKLRRLRPQAARNPGQKQVVSIHTFHERIKSHKKFCSNAPKYRLVVRFTNKDIIVQIVYARLQGDFVLCAAHSRELPRYGINHGLTNWSAGMCTKIPVHKVVSNIAFR